MSELTYEHWHRSVAVGTTLKSSRSFVGKFAPRIGPLLQASPLNLLNRRLTTLLVLKMTDVNTVEVVSLPSVPPK
jgi:hypothetical protein